jgi:hypothetical protein
VATRLQTTQVLLKSQHPPNQGFSSQPNGLKMSRKPIRPTPTYQVPTTAAIPEGMMAAYLKLQARKLVGSIFELDRFCLTQSDFAPSWSSQIANTFQTTRCNQGG